MITTTDIGLAIRDTLEGGDFHVYVGEDETPEKFRVDFVDISDTNNPVVHALDDRGDWHRFRVTIVSI